MNKTHGVKNVIFSLASQFTVALLGLVIPRLVLVNLGSESNGLLNAISTALKYMSLLEAGVGAATLQALYRPVAENDRAQINRILSATHYYYRRTGLVYLGFVLILSVVFAAFIDTTIPRLQVFSVVLLAGLSGVMSYFVQGKFKLLLDAEGKSYISTVLGTVTHVGASLLKIVVLLAGGNVVAVQASFFCFSLLQIAAFVIYSRKHYGWIDYKANPDFNAISQKNAVLVHQISGLIFNNTDVLLLTLFASLKDVSVYSMYALIFGTISTVTTAIDGFLYALGQSFRQRERFVRLYDVYETYKMAMAAALFCVTRILILPFLRLYTAGVTDINYIDPAISWLFAAYYFLHFGRQSSNHLINIAQRFEDTKWRSILESAINLVVSLTLTKALGIYGVLLGTIAALLYRTNDMIIYAAGILERSSWITYRRWLRNIALFGLVELICSRISVDLSTYPRLLAAALVLSVTVVPLFLAVNSLFERESAAYAIGFVKDALAAVFKKRE